MVAKVQKVGLVEVKYFVKGEEPTLLIHSGTHGNEAGVIESVRLALAKYESRLPDFIFVPEVSPSAVAQNTRESKEGYDLNRIFTDDSPSDEVRSNMEIIKGHSYDEVITFHEDSEASEFYLYDCSVNIGQDPRWVLFKNKLKELGVGLFTGIDDPDDPALGVYVDDGYVYFENSPNDLIDGFFPSWIIGKGYAKGVLNLEVPGKAGQELKNRIVDMFFEIFLLSES